MATVFSVIPQADLAAQRPGSLECLELESRDLAGLHLAGLHLAGLHCGGSR